MADHVVRYEHHIDVRGNELRNAIAHPIAGLPPAVAERAGWFVFNTTDARLYYCTGGGWELRATTSDLLDGRLPAYYLDRAHHTGQQPASTLTGLVEAMATVPLDKLGVPTGPVNLGNQELTNAAAATSPTSVPTWAQVMELVEGIGFKHVRLASTGNVTIPTTGVGATIDGSVLALNDLVLLKDQTDQVANGIYKVAANALVRDPNNDTAAKMPSGTVVVVDQGSVNAERMFMLTTPAGFVIGVDPLVFSPFGVAPNPYAAGPGISIVTNTISAVAAAGIVVTSAGIGADFSIVARHFEVDIPVPGTGTAVTLSHNLARSPVPVAVMDKASRDEVKVGVNYPDDNSVLVDFSVAPVAGQYRISVG